MHTLSDTAGTEPLKISEADERGKAAFQVPKLTFIKPSLVRQGDFTKITAGFFGTFLP